ncbi:hypothetical protein SAMN04488003_12719 [Loktanella fryxellensis]|uniref:Uncharacterized protein n=1 Tax=Loktanella fryxellensis TaxID=245187 RepID=A0A1H8IPG5_9RHOB|nr:hypothetical protein [Loktanella fryxellensis]SEN70309.1 hypothetical protein SAMN04488003_12719 [Loktanella fryxellensis]
MLNFVRFVWREQRVVAVLTAVALCVMLVFAADAVSEALYFADPAHRDQTIAPWMSIRYVEQSWDLTKPAMFAIIGLDPQTPPDDVPKSVGDYLRDSGQSLADFQGEVAAAQQALRAAEGQ